MRKLIKLPKFKNQDAELSYWSKIDLADYFEPKEFRKVSFPNLKPTSHSISLRLPEYLLNRLKERANEADIPYQSLIKSYLNQALIKK